MAVRQIVARACGRAGLPRLGAHRLRHTLASDLLRAGNSLPQIGQVLRHRSQLSTAIYAKVDTARLRDVARPWPRTGLTAMTDQTNPTDPIGVTVPRRARVAGWVAAGGPGVPGHPTGAGVHAVDAGPVADGLRRLL